MRCAQAKRGCVPALFATLKVARAGGRALAGALLFTAAAAVRADVPETRPRWRTRAACCARPGLERSGVAGTSEEAELVQNIFQALQLAMLDSPENQAAFDREGVQLVLELIS
jgi:hypothetical protein